MKINFPAFFINLVSYRVCYDFSLLKLYCRSDGAHE